jgi:flagellar biosynthesis protein FlhG
MDQAEKLRKMVKQQTVPRRIARVITVTSGKGGVGKSSMSVNLAIALSRLGKRVVVLDADFGLANVEVMLGIRPQYNLADLMFRGKTLTDIITPGPENIGFISGGSGVEDLVKLDKSQLNGFIENMSLLDSVADFILIDTGAGLSENVMSFALAADDILLVTTPEPTSLTDAYALIKMVSNRDRSKNIKIIVNRAENAKEGNDILQKMSIVADRFLKVKLQPLGFVLQDEAVKIAVKTQEPFYIGFPKSQATKYIKEISYKLVESGNLVNGSGIKGIKGFVGKLVGFLNN